MNLEEIRIEAQKYGTDRVAIVMKDVSDNIMSYKKRLRREIIICVIILLIKFLIF